VKHCVCCRTLFNYDVTSSSTVGKLWCQLWIWLADYESNSGRNKDIWMTNVHKLTT